MVSNFNSIKVQLRPREDARTHAHITNFNSIKVQLRQAFSPTDCSEASAFQFHKGTIKTGMFLKSNSNRYDFNSIKVQLRQDERMYEEIAPRNFNSIKVQLRLGAPFSTSYEILKFQFHKGTIKTPRCPHNASLLLISIP